MTGKSIEERVQEVEVAVAVIRHDLNNVRMSMTGIDIKIDRTDGKIDRLQATVFRIGISIIGSILLLLMSVIAYFLMQKDNHVETMQAMYQTQSRTTLPYIMPDSSTTTKPDTAAH